MLIRSYKPKSKEWEATKKIPIILATEEKESHSGNHMEIKMPLHDLLERW